MKTRVLIVDDNSAGRYLLESTLKGFGLEVVAAENGREALEKARSHPPDLIVADILMPVMDGYTLCREWKADAALKHIPFVFYTATYTEARDEAFALDLGADSFIVKPQEPEALMDILRQVLAKSQETAPAAPAKPCGEEMEFFRQYNTILFHKLEKKMEDLEIANENFNALNERYRLFFDHATDVIYTIGADLKITSVSPSMERILGYKPREFIGRSVADLGRVVLREDMEKAIADIKAILAGNTISTAVYRFIASDGKIKYGEVSGSPIMHDGRVKGIISVARDITARKLAEEQLRKSERMYRELYDFLPIPVYEMDFEGNITAANRAIYDTFGGTEDDLRKGFNAWQLLPPEDVARAVENIQRLLKGEPLPSTEYNIKRLDGKAFPAIIISSLIFRDGKPAGLRGAVIDITERRRYEKQLQNMLDNLQKAVATTIQVMASAVEARDPYTAGHQLRVAELAQAIAREMGLPQEKIDGIRMAGSIHDIGKLSVPAEILSKPTKLNEIEFSLVREHSRKGYEMLRTVDSTWPLAEVVFQHHERMDGSGYPRHLRGEEIIIEARIIAVADVVESMSSQRPYRPSLGIEAALEEIEAHRGILYDAPAVAACLKLFREKRFQFKGIELYGASLQK